MCKIKRTIIKIDENLCNGCGDCIQSCHEGALQIVNGKARIISDTYCDGLGACIGTCPQGAITLEEREAEPYDEQVVDEHVPCHTFSGLNQWPIQLHLLNPSASYLKITDWVLAADCTAFAYGAFHNQFIKNNGIMIACPKLDRSKDIYVDKIITMINNSSINTLTVIIMEVPCCRGLLQIALEAQANAERKIPIKEVIIGIDGNLQSEKWI